MTHTGRHTLLERLWLAALGLALLLLPGSFLPKNKLQLVKESGKLVVLTINGPTTYYEGPDGYAGFEYDLAKAFAHKLGVKLDMVVVDKFSDVLPRIARGDGDFAAAGITVTEARKHIVRFSPPYQEIRQQVVYQRNNVPPRNVQDLIGRDIAVVAGTSYVERLEELKKQYPDLDWTVVNDMSVEELLIEVWEGLQDLTVADSQMVAVVRQFYPELHVAFDLQKPEPLAWAFPLSDDNSLYNAAANFIDEMQRSGELARLKDRYYGPATRTNYLNVVAYQRRIENILPLYKTLFEKAGKATGLDWRLLAAQAYQESMWDPEAVSPTGVRGIMMLTDQTAAHLGVADRSNPEDSIMGGARYLKTLYDNLPPSIKDPDRVWMALAAYNVGMGHLEDARVITQKQGGNPDKWTDVRERLPLLAKPKWYATTEHGYARGYEPVRYVSRIRTYYDILVKIDEDIKARNTPGALKLDAPAI